MQDNHYTLMARYNTWMNEKLYELCADLSDEQRKQDRQAFFRSIHGTLDHILWGDKVWMGRFVNEPFNGPRLGQQLYEDFDAMRTERKRVDRWIEDWARQLDPGWLQAPFSFTSGQDGKTRSSPAWALVSHLFNHQTHHRGQVTTLLKQAGVHPGVTDLPWLPGLATITGE